MIIHFLFPIMAPNLASRILLVEPHDDFREVFATSLGLVGYAVDTVCNASEALTGITRFAPNVVVTELRLADSTGFELARKLRQLPSSNDLILVALCSYVRPTTETEALEAGFDYFLAKPVSVEHIIAILQSLVATKNRKPKCWLQ